MSEKTPGRRQPRETLNDTFVKPTSPAEPLVFGARTVSGETRTIPETPLPSAPLEKTFVRAEVNSMTPPSQIPNAPDRKNGALVLGLFTLAGGMAFGLILLKGGTVSKGATQQSMVALDALYASWKEPPPPGPCRKSEEFELLAKSVGDFTALTPDRRTSAETAYLVSRATFEAEENALGIAHVGPQVRRFRGSPQPRRAHLHG